MSTAFLTQAMTSDLDTTDVLSLTSFSFADKLNFQYQQANGVLSFDTTQFAALGYGQSKTLVFDFSVSDDSGADNNTASGEVIIEVQGSDDQPSISPVVAVTNEDAGLFTLDLVTASGAAAADPATRFSLSGVTLDSGRSVAFTQIANSLEFATAQFNDLGVFESETVVFDFTVDYSNVQGSGTLSSVATITIAGKNDAPTVSVANDVVSLPHEEAATNSGILMDADRSSGVTIRATDVNGHLIGALTQDGSNSGTWNWSLNSADAAGTITITATDTNGVTSTTTFELVATNTSPQITSFTSNSTGATVSVSGTFTDLDPRDTHTAVIDWGDGTTSAATIDETTGNASGDHVYNTGGLFTISLALQDDHGGDSVAKTTSVVTINQPVAVSFDGENLTIDNPTTSDKQLTITVVYGQVVVKDGNQIISTTNLLSTTLDITLTSSGGGNVIRWRQLLRRRRPDRPMF